MNWGSWGEFWAMSGHGLYVWGSYAVTFGALALEVTRLAARRRRALESARERP
jgi:heme exporter protein D